MYKYVVNSLHALKLYGIIYIDGGSYMKINGLEWTIREVDTRSMELIVNNNECWGTCKYSTQEIILDETLRKDKKYRTLIHELTHAYLYSYLLERKETYTEELVCEFVALYGERIIEHAKEYMKI